MICQICKSSVFSILKVIKGIRIYECHSCTIGFIDQKTRLSTSRSLLRHRIDNLYNFEGYKTGTGKLRKRFENLVNIIAQDKKHGNVLDIGAGYGLFSSILAKKGNYQIDIVEPFSKLQYVNKIKPKTYTTIFEKFRVGKKKYNIILMLDVLEHFKDPLNNLKKAKSLLKKEGVLVIQTPNYKSLMARICRDWSWWMIEDHKFFFSPKSLRLMLQKAGFKEKYFITYEDWEDFKKNLDGNFSHIKNNIVRRIVKGFFLTVFISAYLLFRQLFWKLNLGGLIFTIYSES